MAGGGNYPIMMDIEWAAAPWNEVEPKYETCPECNGDRGVYYNEDGEELSSVDYERLSDEDKALWIFDKCERCDGTGYVSDIDY